MNSKTKRIQRRRLNRQEKKNNISNVDVGEQFEWFMTEYFNEYMDTYSLNGLAYMYPIHPNYTQKIDVLIDNFDSMFIGIECKSVYEDGHPLHNKCKHFRNTRFYFSKLFRINKNGESQLHRQHQFLVCTDRRGLIAFEFRCMDEVFLVPHQIIYDKWKSGNKFITS